ncbi:MAG: hypothetical protein ACI381_06130 [Candidatus Methanomethylophilaceae archaeon]
MTRVILAILAIAAILFGFVILISPEQSDADPEIFAWPSTGEGGDIELTFCQDGTAIFRAVPLKGWAVGSWTDQSGKDLGSELVLSIGIASAGDVTLDFIPASARVVNLEWTDHDGSTFIFTTTIDSDDFYALIQSDLIRNATNTHSVPDQMLDDPVVSKIVSHITETHPDVVGRDLADTVLHFVQDAIDYRSDLSLYGCNEWWAMPTETVYSGSGDCEDTSALFVAIASMMGLDVGFLAMPGASHMAAGVILGSEGSVIAGGLSIIYAETATDSRIELGVIPSNQSIDGTWTPISWSSGGFITGNTVPIGSSATDQTSQSFRTGHITNEPFSTVGGNWDNGSNDGVGYANANNTLSNSNTNNGARLTFIHHNLTDHSGSGLTSWWNDKKNLSVPVGSASIIGDPTARDLNEGRWCI